MKRSRRALPKIYTTVTSTKKVVNTKSRRGSVVDHTHIAEIASRNHHSLFVTLSIRTNVTGITHHIFDHAASALDLGLQPSTTAAVARRIGELQSLYAGMKLFGFHKNGYMPAQPRVQKGRNPRKIC